MVLPESEGMELLLCYNDEGVYVNTYSEVTKDVMMQWGELPASVAYIRSGQVNFLQLKILNWCTAIRPSLFALQLGKARKFQKSVCNLIRPSSDVLTWPYCRAPV